MVECKSFQEKMKVHCDVIYEEGQKLFGVSEGVKRARGMKEGQYASRREERIRSVVLEKRELRKNIRQAQCSIMRDGYKALLDELDMKHKRLRRAEKRRKKQKVIREAKAGFKKDPFKAVKRIIQPAPVGKLKCTTEELNQHLRITYGDNSRGVDLGDISGLPTRAEVPEIPCPSSNITRKEHEECVRKASSPGNNAIPYKVYKRCPKLSAHLWNLNRSAFKTGQFPDCCRYSEGVYIPKTDGDFTPATGRPISLMNVQGKLYLAVLAKRLTKYAVENNYIDTSIQKGGIPEVRGCIEHFGSLWDLIRDARINRKDLSSVWLDLANAYGNVPHLLILKALRFYHVPDKIVEIIMSYFSGVFGRFSEGELVSEWVQFEIGIFTGGVISGILFVLAINLLKELLKQRVHKSIVYYKGNIPTPLLRMFMDDCNITVHLPEDMQQVLDIIQEFMVWSRFKLKSSKSRVLCYNKGCVDEETVFCIDGENVPNVAEHPIKFLGRWIRASAKDKQVIADTITDLKRYLLLLDKSKLSQIQKCWGYQFMILPKMKWLLAIYEFP